MGERQPHGRQVPAASGSRGQGVLPWLRIGLVGVALLLSGLVWVGACAASAQDGTPAPVVTPATTGLFLDTTRVGTLTPSSTPVALRSRFVEVDFDRVRGGSAGPPEQLTLNLFQDTILIATRERVEPASVGAGFIWIGRIDGAATSEVTLAVGDGVLMGNIRADGRAYQVRDAGNGVHTLREIDGASFPAD